MAGQRLVRVQEKGQVTIPTEIRRRLGLKKGDLVALSETAEGILITPQQVIAHKALEELGEIIRAQGLSLEEWIEQGREERGRLIRERYGIDPGED